MPWGQLDGGHIAYALFGPQQNRLARVVRALFLLFFLGNLARFGIPRWLGHSTLDWGLVIGNSTFWFVWFILTGVLGRTFGEDHPPTEREPLTPARRGIAVLCLVLVVLLFMPTPFAMY
jgi:membrane-associated protease RseP (regulator of RpoE activity)